MKNFSRDDKLRILAALVLVLLWLSLPLYLQMEHGFSAVQVSFGITVIYYLVYRIMKRSR